MIDLDTNVVIIIAIVSSILLVILLTSIGICICIRHKRAKQFRRRSTINTDRLVVDGNLVTVNETKRLNNGDGQKDESSDVYKYLGVSLNDLPFIDDSKYSSIVDLTSWSHNSSNPYKPLTNNL